MLSCFLEHQNFTAFPLQVTVFFTAIYDSPVAWGGGAGWVRGGGGGGGVRERERGMSCPVG